MLKEYMLRVRKLEADLYAFRQYDERCTQGCMQAEDGIERAKERIQRAESLSPSMKQCESGTYEKIAKRAALEVLLLVVARIGSGALLHHGRFLWVGWLLLFAALNAICLGGMRVRRKRQQDIFAKKEQECRKELQQGQAELQKSKQDQEKYQAMLEEHCKNEVLQLLQTELDNLYALNILAPQYRTLPATCQIAEYLDNERCSELEGPAGAYALYELDLKRNRVIGDLDTIPNRMEAIKASQKYLYEALQTAVPAIERLDLTEIITQYLRDAV